MKKTCLLTLSIISVLNFCFAQGDEEDIYLQIGEQDATKYLQYYLEPLFNGIGYGFTSGWYNTAETHEPFGFDISVSGNVAFIPQHAQTFTFRNEEFDKIRLSDGVRGDLPSLFGPQNKADRPELSVLDDNGEELVRVSSPPGAIDFKSRIGVNAVPVPMFQIGVGTYKKTDLKLRLVPKLTFGETTVSMFGLGVQHDVAQWFERLAVRDISISFLGAFNRLKVTSGLNYDEPETEGNEGVFRINGLNLQAIASKEYIDLITIFGGIGYSRAGSRTQILGTYPVGEEFAELPDDPIDFKYGNSSMNLSLGITIKLLAVTATLSHTIQKYHVTTVGFGVSIR